MLTLTDGLPDPADVINISGYFSLGPNKLDHVYMREGVTYAITIPKQTDPLSPVDATIWRYEASDRDVGGVAAMRIHMAEVGTVSGMTQGICWNDDDETHDVPGLSS